jgi:hypothetical protein
VYQLGVAELSAELYAREHFWRRAMLAKPSTCALVKLLRRKTRTRQVSNAVMEIVSKDGTRLVVGLSLPRVPLTPARTPAQTPPNAIGARNQAHLSLVSGCDAYLMQVKPVFMPICKPATDSKWSKILRNCLCPLESNFRDLWKQSSERTNFATGCRAQHAVPQFP